MPTIDIPDKICPHCGDIKWVTYQRTKTLASGERKTYIFYKCAKKNIEAGNKWRKNHTEHHRKTAREYVKLKRRICKDFAEKSRHRSKIYYKNNKEARYIYRKAWSVINIEKDREYSRRNAKKQMVNLTDYYISNQVAQSINVSSKDIPQKLIEIKRKQLLLTRQTKNNGKDN